MDGRRAAGVVGWAALLMLALTLAAGGCDKGDPCAKACKRVAKCKAEAARGEKMLGEKDPPPDKDCMHQCATQPDVFASCVERHRTCETLRPCYGEL